MGSFDSMGHPQLKKIKTLGARFEQLRKQLSDFRTLTNRKYLNELLGELDAVRSELVEMDSASLLDDGTLIIRTEFLVPFLNPSASDLPITGNRNLDLNDPGVIRRVALHCSIEQWQFLSKRLPNDAAREEFIKACVRELRKLTDGDEKPE